MYQRFCRMLMYYSMQLFLMLSLFVRTMIEYIAYIDITSEERNTIWRLKKVFVVTLQSNTANLK